MAIHVAIKGGLGNQLFQYALGSYLKQSGHTTIFYDTFPLTFHEENLTPRHFLLDRLFSNIPLTEKKVHDLFHTQHDSIPLKAYKKIVRAVNRYVYISETNPFTLKLQPGKNYYLDGYWQNAGVAESLVPQLNACTEHVLKNSPYASKIEAAGESVALHIRRGDYVDNAFINEYHGNCDLSYYIKAMQVMEQKINVSTYFIFSDDLAWAKEHIKSAKPLVFVEGDANEPLSDLFLMKSCKHQVIANSSFSCWASYLNPNPAKTVIAPLNWTRREKTNELPLFKDTWTVI